MGFPTDLETDKWTVVKARWFKPIVNQKREVRVIVIHTMEADETDQTAENVANYFKNVEPTNKVSAHLCIDNNSIVQCVLDNDVAYAAPGANHNGIQLELAGFASQRAADWSDPYSKALLENAAEAAAQYCLKYNLPRKHLTNDELKAGKEGFIGHIQVSEVFKLGDHTDPGKNFPWNDFIANVEDHFKKRKSKLGL